MKSLRARLIAGLLVLTAIGLLVASGVTYVEQRSFLYNRVDQQVRAAISPIRHQLDGKDTGPDNAPPPGNDRFGPGRGGGPDAEVNLPPGTYGQRRNAGGRVLGSTRISYGQPLPAAPKIPARLELGEVTTVDSTSGSGPSYRVLAARDGPGGGTTVVGVPLGDVDQTLNRLLRIEASVIVAVLLALALTAALLVRLGLRPLDRMAVAAGEIAGGRLHHRVEPADGATEVGRLGLALNAMLERLERAFAERQASEDRLRRFLSDAAHELRTPLASIRGYAELFRLGAASDPKALEDSMRRIESESQRMGVLVEDMLTLARLDELREPLREPVDLSEIARDAVADAGATAPDRRISLEASGSALVSGDQQQLRQVVANLMRNALIHTPDGTPIEVRTSGDGVNVMLEVRDHGPGLPPEVDPATLFQRFWRAEAGRRRGAGGAGLGLAIVGEIVDAHGGRVEAANAPSGGASFVIRLPRPLGDT